MALSRDDLLGVALFLWAGAGLLVLFLLGNPQAALLQERLGCPRLLGMVLALLSLGLLLAARHTLAWAWLWGALALVLLPEAQAVWAAPAALLAGTAGAMVLTWRRQKHRRDRRVAPDGRCPAAPPRLSRGGAAGAARRCAGATAPDGERSAGTAAHPTRIRPPADTDPGRGNRATRRSRYPRARARSQAAGTWPRERR